MKTRTPPLVFIDFEFGVDPGECPVPCCVVFQREWESLPQKVWIEPGDPPPIDFSSYTMCAYFASAELSCFHALKWGMPDSVVDLYYEFKLRTSGLELPFGSSLVGALRAHGLSEHIPIEKEEMRALALRGGPYTADERQSLLDYCEQDVVALRRLFEAMNLSEEELFRAEFRGRYAFSVAHAEHLGVPLDVRRLDALKRHWNTIRRYHIEDVNQEFGVFEGTSFRYAKFEAYLQENGYDWPRNPETGRLILTDAIFDEMSLAYPIFEPLREARRMLSSLRSIQLTVGADGRNRCLLSPFATKTGRSAPSTSKFIFGAPAWMRGLITPDAGKALIYLDWEQQEFGIAAALSGDENMQSAYRSSDPYLAFAKQAGAVPLDATKASHGPVRDIYKQCVLGVQYGMGARALSRRIGRPLPYAEELLAAHKRIYPSFWAWQEEIIDHAMLTNRISTQLGWELHVTPNTKPRTLGNFPMQATGAEMLRVFQIAALLEGISVVAPVHDAVLIECDAGRPRDVAEQAQDLMRQTSGALLRGFELRSESWILGEGDRVISGRSQEKWDHMMGLLARAERESSRSIEGTEVFAERVPGPSS